MDVLETVLINGKYYISNIETSKEKFQVPIKTSDGKNIYGIDTLAFINQPIKELTIPKEIKDIKESAFVDCDNLETVFIDSKFDKFINLDNCFKKDFRNILFLVDKDIYEDCNAVTEEYMKMKYVNIFHNPFTQYLENEDTIYFYNLPEHETEIYIPDEYNGKKVSLEKLNPQTPYTNIEKMRIPPIPLKYYQFPLLEELCISSKATEFFIPESEVLEKIICYENIENISALHPLKQLKYFTIGASAKTLKTFNVSYKETPWFKEMKKNSQQEIIFDGILLEFNKNKYLEEYSFNKEVLFAVDGLFMENKNIKKVIFNKNMKNISRDLFKCCENLKTVIIPKNIKYIGPRAFFEEEICDKENKNEYSKEIIFEGNKDDIEIEEAAFEYSIDLPFY